MGFDLGWSAVKCDTLYVSLPSSLKPRKKHGHAANARAKIQFLDVNFMIRIVLHSSILSLRMHSSTDHVFPMNFENLFVMEKL